MDNQTAEPKDDDRITIRLSPDAKKAVDEIVRLGGFKTRPEALRSAIGTELFLLLKRTEGWTVLLRKADEYSELIWPPKDVLPD